MFALPPPSFLCTPPRTHTHSTPLPPPNPIIDTPRPHSRVRLLHPFEHLWDSPHDSGGSTTSRERLRRRRRRPRSRPALSPSRTASIQGFRDSRRRRRAFSSSYANVRPQHSFPFFFFSFFPFLLSLPLVVLL
ncbi:hypothetical protein CGRA01v4_12798 [Colletotrichum graminicola]|nr:hypothetical protein CGRA01v4_12798 [Colletotrichum graminicola]